MKNLKTQSENFPSPSQTATSAQWSKPQLTATPLRDALSGGNNVIDGFNPVTGLTASS